MQNRAGTNDQMIESLEEARLRSERSGLPRATLALSALASLHQAFDLLRRSLTAIRNIVAKHSLGPRLQTKASPEVSEPFKTETTRFESPRRDGKRIHIKPTKLTL